MAYFKQPPDQSEQGYTRRFDLPDESRAENDNFPQDEYDDYDDGFDALSDENGESVEEELLTEEEKQTRQKNRYRLFTGIGDLAGTVIGTVIILLLIALLLSMINFLRRDMGQNLTLLKTKW